MNSDLELLSSIQKVFVNYDKLMIFMNACKLIISNYKGLYCACTIQIIYGCQLLHRLFLAADGRDGNV